MAEKPCANWGCCYHFLMGLSSRFMPMSAIYQYKYSSLCYSTWTSWPPQQWLKPHHWHVRMTSNKTASIRRCPPVLKKTLFNIFMYATYLHIFLYFFFYFYGDRPPQTTCCPWIYYSVKHGSTKYDIFQPYGTFQSFTSPNDHPMLGEVAVFLWPLSFALHFWAKEIKTSRHLATNNLGHKTQILLLWQSFIKVVSKSLHDVNTPVLQMLRQ